MNVQSCHHHRNQVTGFFFYPLQSSHVLLCGQFLPQGQPVFCHYSFAISRMLCEWNHTVFSFWGLGSLIWQKHSRFSHGGLCIRSPFIIIIIICTAE